jgi:hypothetical protein
MRKAYIEYRVSSDQGSVIRVFLANTPFEIVHDAESSWWKCSLMKADSSLPPATGVLFARSPCPEEMSRGFGGGLLTLRETGREHQPVS